MYGFKRLLTFGVVAAIAMVGIVYFWGARASITGAVIAPGSLIVDGNLQIVQHLDGGEIQEVLVKNGDVVKKDDVLIRFRSKPYVDEQKRIEQQLCNLLAQEDRYLSVVKQSDGPISFDPRLVALATEDHGVQELLESQNAQLELARDLLERGRASIESQIEAQKGQLDAIETRIEVAQAVYDRAASLVSSRTMAAASQDQPKSELAALQGDKASIQSEITRLENEKLALEVKLREDALEKLTQISPEVAELENQMKQIRDKISYLAVTAPVSGTIFNNAVDNEGVVVRPGERLLSIIPSDAELVVQVRVQPVEIDEVVVGKAAKILFTGLDARFMPEVLGRVVTVSGDAIEDAEYPGQPFYTADIEFNDGYLEALGGTPLVPGMPIEAFIATTPRTPLSYVTQPMADYFYKAFRS